MSEIINSPDQSPGREKATLVINRALKFFFLDNPLQYFKFLGGLAAFCLLTGFILFGGDFYLVELGKFSNQGGSIVVPIKKMIYDALYLYIIYPLIIAGVTAIAIQFKRQNSFSRALYLTFTRLPSVFAVYLPFLLLLLLFTYIRANSSINQLYTLVIIPLLIYYFLKSSLAVSVIMVESRRAFHSIKRSFALTRGQVFDIFLKYLYLELISYLIMILPILMFYVLSAGHYNSLPMIVRVIPLFFLILLKQIPFWSLLPAANYFIYLKISAETVLEGESTTIADLGGLDALPVLEVISLMVLVILIFAGFCGFF